MLSLYFMGQIPDIDLRDLVVYMLPGSDQSMTRLIETHNPYAVIENPRTSEADAVAGAALFRDKCASCHGPDATGGPAAPALVNHEFKHGVSDWAIYRTIRDGVANTAMLPIADVSEIQRWQVISFLRFIDTREKTDEQSLPRARVKALPYSELAETRESGADWLTYSGSYSSTRYSRLDQINTRNVDTLRLAWVRQFANDPHIEASPLVRDGVMYLTVPPCEVVAVNAATGEKIWSWHCTLMNRAPSDIGDTVNRGVALLDDKIFVATWDARLFALSAAFGNELWSTTVAEPNVYFISAAPLAFNDVVVTGVATREIGRAFILALDVATGRERWKFMAIPGPGEPGNDTWSGDSWARGGAPTWLTGSYDADQDLLYWGVGNPKPDYDPALRAGDNLYTNSVVALQGKTGKLAWHFQFTPADDKDWDANQIPILVDRVSAASSTKQMLWANRNGFYYVLDRASGQFLSGTPFVQQNWAAGLDSRGRPIPIDVTRRSEGDLLYPGNVGGTNWWPPTYYPPGDLMIVPALEQGMVFFSSLASWPRASGRSFYTAVRALDASTGQLKWEYRRPSRFTDNYMGGLVSTAGGLVFGSDQSTFFALDASTGQNIWSVETGGTIIAAPITYSVGGEQYVAVAAGGDLFAFSLPQRSKAPRSGREAFSQPSEEESGR